MGALYSELRCAFCRLRRRPRFTAFAVLLLAFGIGTTAAMFTLMHRALVCPLPFPDPDELVRLQIDSVWDGAAQATDWSYPWFRDLRDAQRSLAEVSAHQSLDVNLLGGDRPERARIELTTASYFRLLGIEPALGRLFTDTEVQGEGGPVVVLGHGLWQRRWAGRPEVLGTSVRIDDTVATVIGVLPEGFRGLAGDVEAWVPLALAPELFYPQALETPWYFWLQVLGRLEPGVSREAAGRELADLVPQIAAAYPLPMQAEVSWSGRARPLRDTLTGERLRTAVLVLLGAVGFILLITCVNLGSLMVARARERRRELAVRASLGAGRWTLLRETVWESLLVTLAGGALGLGLATGALRLSAFLFREVPSGEASLLGVFGSSLFTLDLRVVGIAVGLTLVVGVLAAVLPGLRSLRLDVNAALHCGTPAEAGRTTGRHGGQTVLLTAEVAMALILLLGSVLMARSMQRLLAVDGGFDSAGVMTFRLEPPRSKYTNGTEMAELYRRLWERLHALPGVEAVSFDQCAPFSGDCDSTLVTSLDGRQPESLEEAPQIQVHYVSPDHFELLSSRLVAGRAFAPTDRAGAPPVLLINRAASRRLLDGEPALGSRLALANGLFAEPGVTAEVVGEVDDIHYARPTDRVEPAVYVSALQFGTARSMSLVRTSGDLHRLLPAIRDAVHEVDADLPIFDPRPLTDRVADAFSRPWATTWVFVLFAFVASALTLMGTYALVSHTVARNRRELGVRLALGANHRTILAGVMRHTGRVLTYGLGAGVAGAIYLSKHLSSLLYGVSSFDLWSWLFTVAGLTVTALIAALLPALRTLRIDPTESLRAD